MCLCGRYTRKSGPYSGWFRIRPGAMFFKWYDSEGTAHWEMPVHVPVARVFCVGCHMRSIIQMAKAAWYALSKLWRAPQMLKTCINCSAQKDERLMTACRMRDMCVESRNREILNADIYRGLGDGGIHHTPPVDEARTLCYKCAEAGGYVCWVCELEFKEASR